MICAEAYRRDRRNRKTASLVTIFLVPVANVLVLATRNRDRQTRIKTSDNIRQISDQTRQRSHVKNRHRSRAQTLKNQNVKTMEMTRQGSDAVRRRKRKKRRIMRRNSTRRRRRRRRWRRRRRRNAAALGNGRASQGHEARFLSRGDSRGRRLG